MLKKKKKHWGGRGGHRHWISSILRLYNLYRIGRWVISWLCSLCWCSTVFTITAAPWQPEGTTIDMWISWLFSYFQLKHLQRLDFTFLLFRMVLTNCSYYTPSLLKRGLVWSSDAHVRIASRYVADGVTRNKYLGMITHKNTLATIC